MTEFAVSDTRLNRFFLEKGINLLIFIFLCNDEYLYVRTRFTARPQLLSRATPDLV